MSRTAPAFSQPTIEAARLLGALVAQARRDRRWTLTELAERAGVSAPTVRRVERGDPAVSVGIAFEVATLVGIPLFADPAHLPDHLATVRARLALLPERVRPLPTAVDDDF